MPKISIEQRKPVRIAYIEHTGEYDTLPFETDIPKLFGWAKTKKLKPGFRPLSVYLDPPEVPAPKRRSQLAISIRRAAEGEGEGEIHVRELPAMEVASVRHEGPAAEFAKTYAELEAWTKANGYEWAGAPIETYLRKPKGTPRGPVITAKVQVPVRKRAAT